MSACSSGCPTPGEHKTWGECQRAKGVRIGYCQSAKGLDASKEKRWDRELADYRDARAQGIQPAGTKTDQIRAAVDASNVVGKAFDASTGSFG